MGVRVSPVCALLALLATACHAARPSPRLEEDLTRATSVEDRIDLIARKCARIASCTHGHDAPRFRDPGICVEHWLEHLDDPTDPVPGCLSAATSCADVTACLHGDGDDRAAAYCAAHPEATTSCDGDDLVTCERDDPDESSLTRCAPLGAVCGETVAAGGLVARGCLAKQACRPDENRARCDGDGTVVGCHDQIIERTACRPGTTCHPHRDDDGEEMATCEGPGEVACDRIGQRSCRGAVLVRCEGHGHHAREASVDCSSLGLTCGASQGASGCVVQNGTAAGFQRPDEQDRHPLCSQSGTRCEHGALAFCAAGRPEKVACEDLGLGPCETEARGLVALCGAPRPKRRFHLP